MSSELLSGNEEEVISESKADSEEEQILDPNDGGRSVTEVVKEEEEEVEVEVVKPLLIEDYDDDNEEADEYEEETLGSDDTFTREKHEGSMEEMAEENEWGDTEQSIHISTQSFLDDYEDVLPQADSEGRVSLKYDDLWMRRKKLEQKLVQATARRPCGVKGDILISMRAKDLITGFPPTDGRRHVGAVCAGLRGVTRIRPRLALVPEHRILMRADHRRLTQVKVIAGGRLGHEPLFTEYVGRGMLTAAVLGQTDSAPAAADVSAALRELYTSRGILILTRHTAENRLIFGYAMERARTEGMEKIDMILIDDDCWDRRKGSGGRRGRAGLVLMIKMAGAMAEAGETLKEIYETVRTANSTGLATITAATSPRLLIGGPPTYYLGEEEGETFSGSMKDLVKEMLKYPLDPSKYFSLRTYSSNNYIVLVNTFKTDHWLMYSVVNYVMEEMEARELNVCRVYGDCFVGGAIPGFSITIMTDFKGCRTQWLDLPTECKIWQQVWASGAGSIASFQSEAGRLVTKSTGQMVNDHLVPIIRKAVMCACQAIIACEQVLNTLHVFSRYGTDMRKGAEAILSAVYRMVIDFRFPFNTLITISEIVQHHLPGTTGAMYACLFIGAAQPFLKNPVQRAGVVSWLAALDSALKTLRAYTDSKEGVVSLVLSIIPIVQTIYGPMTRLKDKQIQEGAHPLVLALERVKTDLEKRAAQVMQNGNGRGAILSNQMDVEQYALVVWLDAVFGCTCEHYLRATSGGIEPEEKTSDGARSSSSTGLHPVYV